MPSVFVGNQINNMHATEIDAVTNGNRQARAHIEASVLQQHRWPLHHIFDHSCHTGRKTKKKNPTCCLTRVGSIVSWSLERTQNTAETKQQHRKQNTVDETQCRQGTQYSEGGQNDGNPQTNAQQHIHQLTLNNTQAPNSHKHNANTHRQRNAIRHTNLKTRHWKKKTNTLRDTDDKRSLFILIGHQFVRTSSTHAKTNCPRQRGTPRQEERGCSECGSNHAHAQPIDNLPHTELSEAGPTLRDKRGNRHAKVDIAATPVHCANPDKISGSATSEQWEDMDSPNRSVHPHPAPSMNSQKTRSAEGLSRSQFHTPPTRHDTQLQPVNTAGSMTHSTVGLNWNTALDGNLVPPHIRDYRSMSVPRISTATPPW